MSGREKGLLLLLKVKNQQLVNELFVYAYDNRKSNSDEHGEEVANRAGISEEEGQAVSKPNF